MPQSILDKVHEQFGSTGLKARTEESKKWFLENIAKMRKIPVNERRTVLFSDEFTRTAKPMPGRMYMFTYDALYKDTLPYYDRFPLIFMVGPAEGGFYGMNMHYIAPRYRAKLFDALLSISSDNKYDEKTKLILSYKLLKNAGKFRYFKPCFKHYLTSQIDSVIMKIPASEWEYMLYLPTDSFIGANRQQVWNISRNLF